MTEPKNSAKRLLTVTMGPILSSPLATALPGFLAAASLGAVGASVAQLLPLFQRDRPEA